MPFAVTQSYNNLQEIKWAEKLKLPFKGFLQPVTIDSTSWWDRAKMYRIVEDVSEKKFHPSNFRRILIVLFIVLFFFFLILLITHPQKNSESYIIPIIFIVFFTSLFLYEGFIN